MKKCLVMFMLLGIAVMVCSCKTVPEQKDVVVTTLDTTRPESADDDTEEEKKNPFSLAIGVGGSVGIINSEGDDDFAVFAAEYATDKFGVEVYGKVPLN